MANVIDKQVMEKAQAWLDGNYDEEYKFKTSKQVPFMFKDDVDDGGVILSTVKAKVQGIEDNLYKGYNGTASGFTDAYADLDLASVVDQLLIYEMSMNTEFRHPKSVYMYMDGLGKLGKVLCILLWGGEVDA